MAHIYEGNIQREIRDLESQLSKPNEFRPSLSFNSPGNRSHALFAAALIFSAATVAGCVGPIDAPDQTDKTELPTPSESLKKVDSDKDSFSDYIETKYLNLFKGGPHKPDLFVDIDHTGVHRMPVWPKIVDVEYKNRTISSLDDLDVPPIYEWINKNGAVKHTFAMKPDLLVWDADFNTKLTEIFENNGIALHLNMNGEYLPVAHSSKEDCVRPGSDQTWNPSMPCEDEIAKIDLEDRIVTLRGQRFNNITLLEDPEINLTKAKIIANQPLYFGGIRAPLAHYGILEVTDTDANGRSIHQGDGESPGNVFFIRNTIPGMSHPLYAHDAANQILHVLAKNFGFERAFNPFEAGARPDHADYTIDQWKYIKEVGLRKSLENPNRPGRDWVDTFLEKGYYSAISQGLVE